jgi:hypothetical protein
MYINKRDSKNAACAIELSNWCTRSPYMIILAQRI